MKLAGIHLKITAIVLNSFILTAGRPFLYAQTTILPQPENHSIVFPFLEKDTSISGVFKVQYIKNGKLTIDKDTFRSKVFTLGDSLIASGDYGEFIRLYRLMGPFLPLWKGTPREKNVIGTYYNNIGAAYLNLGIYKQAVTYFYKSLHVSETDTYDVLTACRAYINLSTAFDVLGDTAKVKIYLEKAKEIAISKNSISTLAQIRSQEGSLAFKAGNWDQALSYYIAAFESSKKINLQEGVIVTIIQIASTYLKKDDPEQAIHWLQKGLRITAHTKSKDPLYTDVNLLGMLGSTYLTIKNYPLAEKYLKLALINGAKINAKKGMESAYKELANLYAMQGNYKEAFEYHQKYFDLFQELFGAERINAIDKMEIKYRTAQKDKEIAEKQSELKEQARQLEKKNTLIGIISSGTLILILITFLIIRNFKNKQRLQISERENIRLKALMNGEEKERNRIARDLHDGIGGLLSAAKMSFSSVHPPNNIPVPHYTKGIQLLDEAYKELRQTAHNLSPEILKNKGLLEASRIFCEKIAHNKNLDINFQSFGDLPYLGRETELSLYRILQELMQNIVKHAKATQAVVQISVEGDDLNIVVEDNGSGIMEHKKENGIGMNNLKSRVEALHGKIDIDSRINEGTTIYLEFSILSLQNIA